MEEALYLVSQIVRLGGRGVDRSWSTAVTPALRRFRPRRPTALAGTPLAPLAVNLGQLGMLVAKEDEQLARVSSALPEATLVRVPFLARDVSDLGALGEVAGYLP